MSNLFLCCANKKKIMYNNKLTLILCININVDKYNDIFTFNLHLSYISEI